MNDKPIKILLIEDDPADADYLLEILSEDKNSPFKIEWVDRLHAGLDHLSDSRFDIVLLDLSLPDSQGLDTFNKVHTQTQYEPIIILSGLDDETTAVNAVRGGAQDYLVKGQVNNYLLKRSIYYAIQRKQAEQELKARQQEIEKLNVNLEKRVQEELEMSRRKDYIMIQQSRLAAMGEMIRYITHQWGQPLWALELLFQNLDSSIQNLGVKNEDTDDLIADGIKLVKRMVATMHDFKSFFQTNKEKINFNVNKNIKDTLKLIGPSFKHSNISVTLNEKDQLTTLGFPNEYSQVVLNILNNAKDAVLGKAIKGEIEIELFEENGSAVTRIKDNGDGIPESVLDKIFDSYFTTKTEDKGTGIGLYMSKIIIEEHMNGRINVKNTKEGAEFEIILPMTQS